MGTISMRKMSFPMEQNESMASQQHQELKFDLSVPSKSVGGEKRKRQADTVVVEGARIVVVDGFMSNQAKKKMLTVGLTGTVARMDQAGDANIVFNFEDGAARHWVLKKNFHKIQILDEEVEADEDEEEETASPEVQTTA